MVKYWADEIAGKIIEGHKGTIVLEMGITPSGPYHIGHLREMVITDTVRRALEKQGAQTRLIYFIDDLDNLRKLYPFLPKEFEKYIHHPICQIPAPDGSSASYADYFLNPFLRSLEKLGIEVEKIYAHEFYESGKMTEVVSTALEKKDKIAEILTRISRRQLPERWQPFEPLDETCGRIRGAQILEVNTKSTRVKYVASDGSEKWADYSKGQGKLPWRIDWPARWALLDVAFEPFGKEHAASGGSYDVGKEIVEKIYGKKAPEYEVYEHIYLAGESKKMSASLGNLIDIKDFLEVVPPEVARYFVLRSKNNRHLVFDPGRGFISLADEYANLEKLYYDKQLTGPQKPVIEYSQVSKNRSTVDVPFGHLVMVYQAAQGDLDEVKRLLEHTGHISAIENDESLRVQVERVKNWLKKYAPEEYKFTVLKEAPKIDIDEEQKRVLSSVKKAVEEGKTGIDLHNAIYEAGKSEGLNPRDTFKIIYQIFIGRDSGPKGGFFLSMLDKDFVLDRLNCYL